MSLTENIHRVGVGFIVGGGAVYIEGDLFSFAAAVVRAHCVDGHLQFNLHEWYMTTVIVTTVQENKGHKFVLI